MTYFSHKIYYYIETGMIKVTIVTVFIPKYIKKGVLCMRVATFIISVFIVGMVEMMVAGIMNLMSRSRCL